MDRIPNNPREAARFGALLEDAIMQQQFSEDILRNLPDYTKSGAQPPVPRNSRAIARIPIPLADTIPNVLHTYGVGEVPVHELVQQQQARAAEIEILRAAQALNAPAPPANAPRTPGGTPQAPRTPGAPVNVAGFLNGLLTFLQLASYSRELNPGEDAELAKRNPAKPARPNSADIPTMDFSRLPGMFGGMGR